MADADPQLAALGNQVFQQLLATYGPGGDPELALAVLPGQAVDADVVQAGVENPLVVSNWLRDEFDDPLRLRMADLTPLPGAIGSGIPASALYGVIATGARAVAEAGSDEWGRVNGLISAAKQDLGPNPSALPLGCDPDDWAGSTSTVWHTFDSVIASDSSVTTEGASAPDPPEAGSSRVNPQLWQLRALSDGVVISPAAREQARMERRVQVDEVQGSMMQRVMLAPAATMALSSSAEASSSPDAGSKVALETGSRPAVQSMMVRQDRLATVAVSGPIALQVSLSESAPTVNPAREELQLSLPVSRLLLADIVAEPTVPTVTTTSSKLHVHFEHTLVTITRRLGYVQWWHPEFVADDGWYVPGMHRGELIPPPDATTAHCLPRALVLVRNVAITGQYTAEAEAAFNGPNAMFGPFLLAPSNIAGSNDASSSQETTVLGLGIQVIGILCSLLPVLPPQDDLSSAPAGPAQ